MSVNYTEEQVAYMTKLYEENPTRETVENLAEELGKNAYYCLSDITKEEDIKRAISFTTDKLSKLDNFIPYFFP